MSAAANTKLPPETAVISPTDLVEGEQDVSATYRHTSEELLCHRAFEFIGIIYISAAKHKIKSSFHLGGKLGK